MPDPIDLAREYKAPPFHTEFITIDCGHKQARAKANRQAGQAKQSKRFVICADDAAHASRDSGSVWTPTTYDKGWIMMTESICPLLGSEETK